MPKLKITSGQQEAYEILVPGDQREISIGRSSKNTLCLADVKLSRHHAVMRREDDRYVISDLGSYNGTYLNNKLLEDSMVVQSGDVISAGETEILFVADGDEGHLLTPGVSPASVSLVGDADPDPSTITSVFRSDDLVRDVRKGSKAGAHDADGNTLLLSVLNEATNALITYLPANKLLAFIMKLVFDAIPAERGSLILIDERTGELNPEVVWSRASGSSSSESIQISRSITRQVIQDKTSLLINDTRHDERFSGQQSIILHGVRSAMCVPLWDEQKVIGLIYVDSQKSVLGFTDEMLKILTSLANVAAIKIENTRLLEAAMEKQRMEEELALAGEIQTSLLPAGSPHLDGYEIIGYNVPTYQVGGDYYDYLPLAAPHFGITIADVSGKGTSASLLMASLRASLISLAESQVSVTDLVTRLNGFICKSGGSNRFITFFYGQLDTQTHHFCYCNAGHNPPIVFRANGRDEKLETGGVVLGLFKDARYEEQECELEPGDCLLLYTDGISETVNESEEEFGEQRLIASARAHLNLSIEELKEHIISEVRTFQGSCAQADDMTLVLVRRSP